MTLLRRPGFLALPTVFFALFLVLWLVNEQPARHTSA